MAHHPWAFKELFMVKFFHRVFGYIREVFWVKATKELKTPPKNVINPIYFKKNISYGYLWLLQMDKTTHLFTYLESYSKRETFFSIAASSSTAASPQS